MKRIFNRILSLTVFILMAALAVSGCATRSISDSGLKWTLESRQKSTEFRLHIQLHSQLDGAAPVLVFFKVLPKV